MINLDAKLYDNNKVCGLLHWLCLSLDTISVCWMMQNELIAIKYGNVQYSKGR